MSSTSENLKAMRDDREAIYAPDGESPVVSDYARGAADEREHIRLLLIDLAVAADSTERWDEAKRLRKFADSLIGKGWPDNVPAKGASNEIRIG